MMMRLPRIAGVLYAALLLAGCGGGSSGATLANGGSSTDPIGGEPPPEAIQGIAPPSGVAVVTATNVD